MTAVKRTVRQGGEPHCVPVPKQGVATRKKKWKCDDSMTKFIGEIVGVEMERLYQCC
jgi:hypothetical protein